MLPAAITQSSLRRRDKEKFENEVAHIISQVRTIAAFAYRRSRGLPIIYPKPQNTYSANFLHMMFSVPYADYELKPEVVRALDLIFLLHGRRLVGFGHRVYKNYDPRAKIIKKQCDELLEALQISDPLLDIAMRLEQAALHDPYFIERKLYPNVDFYSGIMMRAIGIPVEMFTVIFAIGRMPGWIANYREVSENEAGRICRPRQIYVGEPLASYVPIDHRAKG
jgi:citrate synthase